MATREAVLSPLGIYELRYLRKAVRYRIWLASPDARLATDLPVGFRTTPPPRDFPDAGYVITPERAEELDKMADWIVQVEA